MDRQQVFKFEFLKTTATALQVFPAEEEQPLDLSVRKHNKNEALLNAINDNKKLEQKMTAKGNGRSDIHPGMGNAFSENRHHHQQQLQQISENGHLRLSANETAQQYRHHQLPIANGKEEEEEEEEGGAVSTSASTSVPVLPTAHGCTVNHQQQQQQQQHQQQQHQPAKPHHCAQCPKAYTRREGLALHVRTIHQDQWPYQCTECGHPFPHKRSLKVHTRLHTGERPHRCDGCGRAFTQKGHLTAHLCLQPREMAYRCAHCPMQFGFAYRLKLHQRVHLRPPEHVPAAAGEVLDEQKQQHQH